MKKIALVCCVAVSLILGACLQPVDHDLFLKDDKVQDVIGGDGDFEESVDYSPELAIGKLILGKADEVTVSISGAGGTIPTSVIIRVTNDFLYDTISWRWKEIDLPETGEELTVDSAVSPFDAEGHNYLSVIGTMGSIPYATNLVINVVD